MNGPGVTIHDTWRALGMRGSGSNEIVLERAFVPDAAVSLRRPFGKWHLFYNVICTIAFPIFMSAYLGVAEAARALAVQQLQRRRADSDVWYLVGEMDNALTTAQMAVQGMIDLCANYAFTPDVATANAVMMRKTIARAGGHCDRREGRRGGRWIELPPNKRAWNGCCGTCTAPRSTRCSPNASTASPGAWRLDWIPQATTRNRLFSRGAFSGLVSPTARRLPAPGMAAGSPSASST